MTNTELTVEGEPVTLIVEALQKFFANSREEKDGMIRIDGPLEGDSGAALIHALERITAELKAADMRSFLPGGSRNSRTEDQRGFDALMLLMNRIEATVNL